MEYDGKKIMVFGTGISGIAAAKLLAAHGAEVVLYDGKTDIDKDRIYAEFKGQDKVSLVLGELTVSARDALDMLVLSPGVALDNPIVADIQQNGIPVIGEVELAYRFQKGRLLAITGTNGKTTTTSLLGEIMRSYCTDVKVVGNIGIPYAGVVDSTTENTVVVAEISSFQLETIDTFCPDISAILNITPDHLNRHHTMEHYIDAKMNIAKNQGNGKLCVMNYDDEILRSRAKQLNADIFWFSSSQELERGIYVADDAIFYKENGVREKVIDIGQLNILGRHNHENAMAACAMALHAGVPMSVVQDALVRFQAVEHRIEYVAEKRGIRFYNDSKGTNPDAAIKGIQAMDRPTYLIGGGYDKESDYEEWIRSFDGKVRKLVLIGQTREKIAETAEKLGFQEYVFADSLQEAVDICYEGACGGDAVLLSPACASWGMFPNYEVRGKMFKEMVHALKD